MFGHVLWWSVSLHCVQDFAYSHVPNAHQLGAMNKELSFDTVTVSVDVVAAINVPSELVLFT